MNSLLTVKDIQKIFSCGKNRAYAMMHSAGFPSVMINERLYVEESELIEWLKTYKGKQYLL